jgi:anti-anti-sigma factor
MKLTVLSSDAELTHVQCVEDVTLLDFTAGKEPLELLLGNDAYTRRVLLNLEQTSFIDSAGVGWLVRCHKHFQQGGGKLVLHSIPPMVNHVFQLLKLGSILHITEDEATAKTLALGGKR